MVSRVRGLPRADRPGIMDAGIARAHGLSQASLAMVRERRGHAREAWMAEATSSGIDELTRFARGLQDDMSAVKRQGYGRTGFALLRQRVLHAA
jgi:transposase